MQIEYQLIENDLVVRLSGELDLVSATSFKTLVDDLIDRRRIRNLYVNMQWVTFLDSSFLGTLIGRHKRIQLTGGRTGIVAPCPTIRPILEISGILRIMPEFDSEQRALSAG